MSSYKNCAPGCGCGCKSTTPTAPVISPCCEGSTTAVGGLRRTRFFDGMLLSQSDFENEQRYWRSKRALTNRALGVGVVWGFRSETDSALRSLQVGPGYGLDCCGNDVVLECPETVTLRDLLTEDAKCQIGDPNRGARVILEYVECPEDARVVHSDTCSTDTSRSEYARVRESARLRIVPIECPPPGPMSLFQEELSTLMAECPDLFPDNSSEETEELSPHSSFEITTEDGQRNYRPTEIADGHWHVDAYGSLSGIVLTSGTTSGSLPIELAMQADPGWLWMEGKVFAEAHRVGESAQPMVRRGEVQPPMDLRLEWNWEIDLDGLKVSQSTVVELNAEIRDWRLSPIVDDTQTIHGDTIAIRAELRLQRLSDTQVQYTFTTVSVDISAVRQEGRESDRDCFSRLRPGLWQEGCGDNWAADPKILLLAGLHAWLATLSTSAEGDAPWTAQRVAATYIYVIAWRLIYGADLTAGDKQRCRATRLADLLQKLLQRLCEGMTYPGPRCHGCFHGVVLGTLELDTKWQVTGFDSWEGRQHVLLGPLVSHWAGQFGLASFDVVAGRFAQTLCCVAGLPAPRVGKVAPPAEMIAMDSGTRFMFGSTSEVQKEMTMEGLPLVSSGTVSPMTFVGNFLAAITSDKPPNANAGFRHSIVGNQAGKALHLLVPDGGKRTDSSEYANIPFVGALMKAMSGGSERASSATSGHAHIADALRVHKDQDKVPALAREAVIGDITSTLASMPIKNLHLELEGEVYKTLAKSGVRSIDDVLAVGAEAISTYILRGTAKEEDDEHAILVDGLVGSAEEIADRLVDSWVNVAGKQGRSFRRNHVEDAKIRKAVATGVGTAGRKLKEKIDLLPPKQVPAKPQLVTKLKPKSKSKPKPKSKSKPANQESDSPDDKGTDKN